MSKLGSSHESAERRFVVLVGVWEVIVASAAGLTSRGRCGGSGRRRPGPRRGRSRCRRSWSRYCASSGVDRRPGPGAAGRPRRRGWGGAPFLPTRSTRSRRKPITEDRTRNAETLPTSREGRAPGLGRLGKSERQVGVSVTGAVLNRAADVAPWLTPDSTMSGGFRRRRRCGRRGVSASTRTTTGTVAATRTARWPALRSCLLHGFRARVRPGAARRRSRPRRLPACDGSGGDKRRGRARRLSPGGGAGPGDCSHAVP